MPRDCRAVCTAARSNIRSFLCFSLLLQVDCSYHHRQPYAHVNDLPEAIGAPHMNAINQMLTSLKRKRRLPSLALQGRGQGTPLRRGKGRESGNEGRAINSAGSGYSCLRRGIYAQYWRGSRRAVLAIAILPQRADTVRSARPLAEQGPREPGTAS